MTLRPEQLDAFARDGFVGPIDVLDRDGVAAVRAAIARVIAELPRLEDRLYEVETAHRQRPDEVVCHFLGGWRVDATLRDLVFDPRCAAPCAAALGLSQLRFFHDQVFAKPPRHPGVVPWHQDYSYWTRTAPACHVTLNLLLDDSDADSGCLQFVPGSHLHGLLPAVPFDAAIDAVRAHLPADFDWNPVAAPLRAGQATIHHSHVLHGSGANRSARWRRAVVLNYMATDTRVADDSAPLLRGVPLLPRGAVVEGEHFPIVWP